MMTRYVEPCEFTLPSLLDERRAAEFLGVTPACMRAWRFRQQGPAYVRLNGRLVRYEMSELRSYLSSAKVEPGEPDRPRPGTTK